MTLLSVAVSAREAAILVDSGPGPVPSGKLAYIAPGGLVLARMGDPGHLLVWDELRRLLELGVLPQDVSAPAIPAMLRHLHQQHMKGAHVRIVAAQVIGQLVRVVDFDSRRDFEPWTMPSGAWVGSFEPPVPAAEPETTFPVRGKAPPPAPVAPPRMALCVASVVQHTRDAVRDYPDKVAGPFTWCRLSAMGVIFERAGIEEQP